MKRAIRIVALVVFLAAACGAGAQEKPFHPWQVGITAGTLLRMYIEVSYLMQEDAWIGALVHPTPSLALRPSVVLVRSVRDEEDNLAATSYRSDADVGIGAALAGFYYFPARAGLSIYLGPEVKYFYLEQDDFFLSGNKQSEDSSQILQASLLFGAQYMLSERFGFQADVGVGVMLVWDRGLEWNDLGTLLTDELAVNTMFSTRGAYLGAVFYLN